MSRKDNGDWEKEMRMGWEKKWEREWGWKEN